MEEMLLYASLLPDFDLRESLAELIAHRALRPGEELPRTRADYDAMVCGARQRLGVAVQEIAAVLPGLWQAFHQARLDIDEASSPRLQFAADDMREQVDRLTAPGFLRSTPWRWLVHYPRYFRAIGTRIQRLRSGSLQRDLAACEEIQSHWQAYQEQARRNELLHVHDPELEHFRWMLEEYRVSQFAQSLGTSLPVSAKRLARQWQKIHVLKSEIRNPKSEIQPLTPQRGRPL